MESTTNKSLAILWVTQDREAAVNMALMYAKNSKLKGWWEQVRLIVWGPSARVLATDQGLQTELEATKEAGVEIQACKACADRYGVSDALERMGIEVIYMGQPLTHLIKNGWHLLSV
jgi:hypothetical protein